MAPDTAALIFEQGSLIVVTGASGGIGAEVCRLALKSGCDIVAGVFPEEPGSASNSPLSQWGNEHGRTVNIVGLDVTSELQIQSVFETASHLATGPLHLVNCAGIDGRPMCATEVDWSEMATMFAINVFGTIQCCKHAIRAMMSRPLDKRGSIVNVSSMAATIGGRHGRSVYAASKAAVDSYTIGVAREIASAGIRINTVRPAMVATNMNRTLMADSAVRDRVAATIPMNRVAEPTEIAEPILWLLSKQSSFVTGTCLNVSGGGFVIG